MIAGTIVEHRPNGHDRVTTMHLFGDSSSGIVEAEMREHDVYVGYAEDRSCGELKLQRRMTAWRGYKGVNICNLKLNPTVEGRTAKGQQT